MNGFKHIRLIIFSIASVIMSLLPVCVGAEILWVPEPLAILIDEGLNENLNIKSQDSKIESLKAEAVAAGALDDPMVGFGLANVPTDTYSFSQEPMTQKQFFISQKLPWPGKLDLKSQLITFKALKEEYGLLKRKTALSKMISISYLNLGFTDQQLALNAELETLIEQLLEISTTRYSVGKGLQMDVLQGELELSRLLDERITLLKTRRTLEDEINGLLNRKNFQKIPVTPQPDFPDTSLDIDNLVNVALQNNPQINLLRAQVNMADIEVQLAKKKYYPDFDVKFSYGQRDDDQMGQDRSDFVSTSIGINLPLWKNKRQDNQLLAAQKQLNTAQLSVESLSLEVKFKIDALVYEIESAKKNYTIYESRLLNQAEQWVDSAKSAYEVDKLEFDTLISAQTRLLNLKLQQQNYLFNILKKYAELEEKVGIPLSALDVQKNMGS